MTVTLQLRFHLHPCGSVRQEVVGELLPVVVLLSALALPAAGQSYTLVINDGTVVVNGGTFTICRQAQVPSFGMMIP